MTDDNDGRYNLSRRKALAGIGTIGAATALGGLGTYAQFTDTENASFTFTAGGIDGHITAHMAYNGSDLVSALSPDPNGGVSIELGDVKPGDFGSICFDLTVENNPAWVASCIGIESDTDHDTYEPEVAADADVSAADIGSQVSNDPNGELAENLYVIPFYRGSCPSNFWDPDGLVDGEAPNGTTVSYSSLLSVDDVGTSTAFWDSREGTNDSGELLPMTLREAAEAQLALDTVEWNNPDSTVTRSGAPQGTSVDPGCVFLDGTAANTDTNHDDREAAPLQPGDTLSFGYDWHIPFVAGNDVQGDQVVFNLGFNFAQLRHTSAPELANIYSPGDNT